MEANLFEKFGHCTIPKGTLLFHGTPDNELRDCMFFGLTFFVGGVFHNSVQVWRVKKDIDVLFLCASVAWVCRVNSSIPKLFNLIFPEQQDQNFNDLDIKHFDHNRRNGFTEELHSKYAIRGWLSSLEGNTELEVCLFKKETVNSFLELVKVHEKKEKIFYKNSLRKIKVFPPPTFYNESIDNLVRAARPGSDAKSLWNQYKRFRNSCIREGTPSPEEAMWRREEYYDLRAKLKI
jgi:hypothetical protein